MPAPATASPPPPAVPDVLVPPAHHPPPRLRSRVCGEALGHLIADTVPPAGAVDVWWLTQSGFVLRGPRHTVVIDPYLSEHLSRKYAGQGAKEHIRITAAPLRGGHLRGVDAVLVSHKHSDHLDPGTLPDLLAANAAATVLLPEAIRDYAVRDLRLPAGRLIGTDAGREHDLLPAREGSPAVTVRVLASAHEGLDRDAAGRHLYLGFVVMMEGLRFYHSGDTILYPGLTEALRAAGPPDVAFLPINGRDERRRRLGTSGNMTFAEVETTCREVRPGRMVPHHHDLFTFNTADVGEFARGMRVRLPLQRVTVPEPGGCFRVRSGEW